MKNKYLLTIMVLMTYGMAQANETWLDYINDPSKQNETNQRWQADGGEMNLLFFYGMLEAHGIKVNGTGKYNKNNWQQNNFIMPIQNIGGLSLKVPYGNFTGIDNGSLSLKGSFEWQLNDQVIQFKGLSLVATDAAKHKNDVVGFNLINDQGDVLFKLDHIHATLDKKLNLLDMKNMDVSISAQLAKMLNKPNLADLVIAQAHVQSNLTLPSNGYVDINKLGGGACDGRPLWPGDLNSQGEPAEADVALIDMRMQQQRDLGGGNIVVTPSATLKNVGGIDNADVAWHTKFSGIFDPYDNAQHPYLVWNLYREIDGRFEQIGVSGVKHAFLTINVRCTINCGNSHILWPGCEDVYGTGNNDSPRDLGPREEITAFTGDWLESPSFFDPNGNGSQTVNSNGTDENRMVVAEAKLDQPNTEYYASAWYVIKDDIDIYNSMGYNQYDISFNGSSWSFTKLDLDPGAGTSLFENGPASDQYVAPNSFDLSGGTASQRLLQVGEGHLTVAVKVIDNKDGTYRYNYMVENHDYDPQVQTISLPLADIASMTDFVFVDTDDDSANDWTVTHANNALTLQAPADNEIDWGILYSFSFTTDAAPEAGDLVLTGMENGGLQFNASVITPFSGPMTDDLIFENGFEILN